MMRFSPVFLSLTVLLMPPPLKGQSPDHRVVQEILHAQDQRDAVSLGKFMHSPDDQVRSGATLASASVQDTALMPLLISLLEDPSQDVRLAAALSLGQLTAYVTDGQRASLSSALLKGISGERDERVLLRMAEAVGKAGHTEALKELVRIAGKYSESLRAEVALAVGRFGYRSIRNADGTAFAAAGLSENTPETWKGAYGLMRVNVDSLLRPFLSHMKTALTHGDADTRMFLATALGATKSPEAIATLVQAARLDDDWRVRVSAVRALGVAGKSDSVAAAALLLLCNDSNEHVSLTALSTLRSMDTSATTRSALGAMASRPDQNLSVRQREEAARSLAALFPDGTSATLHDAYARQLISEETYVECLGSYDDKASFKRVLDFARSVRVPTARAALNSLDAMVRADPDSLNRKAARDVFVRSLESDDMTIIVTAASALADSLYADSMLVQPLLTKLQGLSAPDDAEAMVAIIQTLGVLKSGSSIGILEESLVSADHSVSSEASKSLELVTGKSYADRVQKHSPAYIDYDWDFLQSLKGTTVQVKTSAGTFSFALLTEEAPFTCMNFARLIMRDFYSGLRFHRVVPNFVIQGGDPRGDGWGGPGYSIRSEFGLQNYDAGMVGVASSGKDTEGCQFFVTHSKQPHLDGRYTIFGKIVSGMEVVDRIQVGDEIGQMRIVGTRK